MDTRRVELAVNSLGCFVVRRMHTHGLSAVHAVHAVHAVRAVHASRAVHAFRAVHASHIAAI
jgi:hypothetical protein